MANNIAIGPQGAKALQNISFADADMVAGNTEEIIKATPDGYLFFNPNNGSIPQITGFDLEGSYIINSKTVRDLSTVVYTGVDTGTVQNVLGEDDGTALIDNDGTALLIT